MSSSPLSIILAYCFENLLPTKFPNGREPITKEPDTKSESLEKNAFSSNWKQLDWDDQVILTAIGYVWGVKNKVILTAIGYVWGVKNKVPPCPLSMQISGLVVERGRNMKSLGWVFQECYRGEKFYQNDYFVHTRENRTNYLT